MSDSLKNQERMDGERPFVQFDRNLNSMQAEAWCEVFDCCRSLGMEIPDDRNGTEAVKDFIASLAAIVAAARAWVEATDAWSQALEVWRETGYPAIPLEEHDRLHTQAIETCAALRSAVERSVEGNGEG